MSSRWASTVGILGRQTLQGCNQRWVSSIWPQCPQISSESLHDALSIHTASSILSETWYFSLCSETGAGTNRSRKVVLSVLRLLWPLASFLSHRQDSNRGWLEPKSHVRRFRLDLRKKFSVVRVVKQWHWSSKDTMDAPSLEVRLDNALRCPCSLQGSRLGDL